MMERSVVLVIIVIILLVVDDTLRQLGSLRAARFFENSEDPQPIVDIASNRRLSLLIH